jgi:hypothetical protein
MLCQFYIGIYILLFLEYGYTKIKIIIRKEESLLYKVIKNESSTFIISVNFLSIQIGNE